jgi:hypothetical protein
MDLSRRVTKPACRPFAAAHPAAAESSHETRRIDASALLEVVLKNVDHPTLPCPCQQRRDLLPDDSGVSADSWTLLERVSPAYRGTPSALTGVSFFHHAEARLYPLLTAVCHRWRSTRSPRFPSSVERFRCVPARPESPGSSFS